MISNLLFTTPKKEDLKLLESFIKALSPKEPVFLKVQEIIKNGAKELECYDNVKICVDQKMGTQQLGWIIWLEVDKRVAKFEAHSVLKTPAGKLIDVTPQSDKEEFILFLPDNSLIDDGKLIPGKFIPLVKDKDILDYVQKGNDSEKQKQEIYSIQQGYKEYQKRKYY